MGGPSPNFFVMQALANQAAIAIAIEADTQPWGYLAYPEIKPTKRCFYCGRDRQKTEHETCDGCGAPK